MKKSTCRKIPSEILTMTYTWQQTLMVTSIAVAFLAFHLLRLQATIHDFLMENITIQYMMSEEPPMEYF